MEEAKNITDKVEENVEGGSLAGEPPKLDLPDIKPVSEETAAVVQAKADKHPPVIQDDSDATETWKPASLLDVPNWVREKYTGNRLRWCRKEEIDKKLLEGWAKCIVDGTEVAEEFRPTMIDASSHDSTISVREMLLMHIPEKMAKAREAHFEKLTNAQVKTEAQKLKDLARIDGGGAYGSITEKVEI